MVRPGAVVAQRFGGVAAHEDGAGVADLRQPAFRIGHRQLQVFRGDAVGNLAGLLLVGDQDQRAAVLQRGADDLGALHGRQQLVDARRDPVEEGRVRADQDRLGVLVVLGLGEQVHGDPVRIGAAVADHEDFRGAGDHVDADLAEHMALGGGDVDVARTDDLVDLRHALGAVGQRGHGLGAADGEDAVDTGDAGGGEDDLVDLATRGRHHHDHFGDAGDLGRNRVHQHRGRVGRLAARHVQAGAIQRGDLLAEHGAVGLGVAPGILLLLLVVAAHARRGVFQGFALGRGDAGQGQFQALARQDQVGHGFGFDAIETLGELHHGGVAAAAHGSDDVQHALVDGVVGNAFPGEQMVQMTREVRISGIESADGEGCGHSWAS
ncbi:hypothetical protein D9M68_618150 [compost metagenome]